MIKHNRAIVGQARTAALIGACVSLAALPGCRDVRMAIGMDQGGPDEFAVESRAPLLIPPDFNLRPPQPGAARPNEVTAADRARRVIDSAGPGEPGKQASFALKASSDGSSPAPGSQLDPNQQVQDNSMASRLLSSGDSAAGDTAASRETTPIKGVY
ncbi:MAG: DUF3035 domain-containing protein [Alphaproteobacteria bacterium]